MRLSTLSSSFVFNLPSDFIPAEIIDSYSPLLEKNFIQYDNVIDYLNSTIKEVSLPGLSIESPVQKIKRGKEINYKPATNINDILATRQFDITFRSVDSDLNYFLLWDIYIKHYLNTEELYTKPFILTNVDIHRDAIYNVKFRELIMLTLSENRFSYNQVVGIPEKLFSITMNFNFIDIEFLLNGGEVLSIGQVPNIIQKIT
jgi:hypothetical protein